MKTLTTACLLGLMVVGSVLPASAQYHKNYGGARVTNQNKIGLYHNDASYVSSGTLGQSARDGGAHKAGMQTGGLPSTAWGGYIRNPGDDIYTGNNGAMRQDNGSMVYGDEIVSANKQKRAMAQRQQQMQMQQQMQQRYNRNGGQQGNYYQPGSNGSTSSYGSSGAAGYSSYKAH